MSMFFSLWQVWTTHTGTGSGRTRHSLRWTTSVLSLLKILEIWEIRHRGTWRLCALRWVSWSLSLLPPFPHPPSSSSPLPFPLSISPLSLSFTPPPPPSPIHLPPLSPHPLSPSPHSFFLSLPFQLVERISTGASTACSGDNEQNTSTSHVSILYNVSTYFGWSLWPHQRHWLHPNPASKVKPVEKGWGATIP